MLLFCQRGAPFLLIGLAAFFLRTFDLARRPMHADEANQAVKLGLLLETGRYEFDARDHHGPTLYYFAAPIAWLRGQTSLVALDETTVRLVPAIAGTISVLLLGALAFPLGRGPALIAAALMAVSPPAVYYSRYFVHETLLVTFTLAALVSAQQWWRHARPLWAIAAGGCGGLMLATKELAPLFVTAALLGVIVVRAKPVSSSITRGATLALFAALIIAFLFYSSFGANFGGLRAAIEALGIGVTRATGVSGHEKPWWYYLRLFEWERRGGIVWQQLGFTALAVAGVGVAVLSGKKMLRWAAVYVAVLAIVMSLVPYKTPWHAIHFVPALALLAAGAWAAIPNGVVAAFVVLAAVAMQGFQTYRAAFVYPADERNPYAYVHSSPDVLKFRALVVAALAHTPQLPIRIISEEYWPLPWYLRGLPRIGYWPAPPDDCDGALVIASAKQAEAVRSRLHGNYRETFLGLRPGFLCVVFVKNTPSP